MRSQGGGVSRRLTGWVPARTAPQVPLPWATAWGAVARCVAVSVVMLVRREICQPQENVGRVIGFADGTTGRVYRETVVPGRTPTHSCVLVVCFRLHGVRGRGHALFRMESTLNTPLFVGFPGFVSKLWLAHDERSVYRGVYHWDGAGRAESYARSLWRVLALVSEPQSIRYRVLPGLRPDDVLARPELLADLGDEEGQEWWRVVTAT
jgi:hypothetical protein